MTRRLARTAMLGLVLLTLGHSMRGQQTTNTDCTLYGDLPPVFVHVRIRQLSTGPSPV